MKTIAWLPKLNLGLISRWCVGCWSSYSFVPFQMCWLALEWVSPLRISATDSITLHWRTPNATSHCSKDPGYLLQRGKSWQFLASTWMYEGGLRGFLSLYLQTRGGRRELNHPCSALLKGQTGGGGRGRAINVWHIPAWLKLRAFTSSPSLRRCGQETWVFSRTEKLHSLGWFFYFIFWWPIHFWQHWTIPHPITIEKEFGPFPRCNARHRSWV